MTIGKPYFMTNKEWYYYDESAEDYKLTDKAPPEAIKSYKEFYEQFEPYEDENGEWVVRC